MIEKLNQILQGLIERSVNVYTQTVEGISWTCLEIGTLVFLFASTTIQPSAANVATEKNLKLPVSLASRIGYICSGGNDQISTLNYGIYGSDLGNDYITIQIFANNTTTRRASVCVVGFKE